VVAAAAGAGAMAAAAAAAVEAPLPVLRVPRYEVGHPRDVHVTTLKHADK